MTMFSKQTTYNLAIFYKLAIFHSNLCLRIQNYHWSSIGRLRDRPSYISYMGLSWSRLITIQQSHFFQFIPYIYIHTYIHNSFPQIVSIPLRNLGLGRDEITYLGLFRMGCWCVIWTRSGIVYTVYIYMYYIYMYVPSGHIQQFAASHCLKHKE